MLHILDSCLFKNRCCCPPKQSGLVDSNIGKIKVAKIILSIFIIYSIYTVYYNIYVVGGAGVSVRKCCHSVVGALK